MLWKDAEITTIKERRGLSCLTHLCIKGIRVLIHFTRISRPLSRAPTYLLSLKRCCCCCTLSMLTLRPTKGTHFFFLLLFRLAKGIVCPPLPRVCWSNRQDIGWPCRHLIVLFCTPTCVCTNKCKSHQFSTTINSFPVSLWFFYISSILRL